MLGYRSVSLRPVLAFGKRCGGRRYVGETHDPRFFKFNTPSEKFKQMLPDQDDEIVISMSSGVDSTVCAKMFTSRYKNVRGIFMANWSSDKLINNGSNSKCTVDEDWLQVREICEHLKIPCERVNFEKEYWTQVFEPMLNEYEKGYTPNPDIGCNKYVKFGKMIEHLNKIFPQNGESGKKWWLVTGHYAKILKDTENGDFRLFRADYKQKDQSYYLTSMPNDVLGNVIMPIGHYTKPEVREIAKDYDLLTKDKPDSQGLCFVSQVGKFKDFLNEYIPPNPGDIITEDGKVWGKHHGLWSATIGQRSGISMPQGDPKYKGVWLVSGKNIEKNQLIISRKDDKDAFYKDLINVDLNTWYWMVNDINWDQIKKEIESGSNRINCQIRSLQIPNVIETFQLVKNGQEISFKINEKIFGVAAGQILALYKDDMLLGSGVIC